MSDKLIASLKLNPKSCEIPSRVRFMRRGVDVTNRIARLNIVQYEDDDGFYLLYCDSEGNSLNDTYHDTILKAKSQAKYSFGVHDDEWRNAETRTEPD